MSVADGQILRAVATFALGSTSKAQNVWHFKHQTGTDQPDSLVVLACREAIETYMDELENNIHTSVELETVEVFERVSGEWQPVGTANSSWAGASTGDRPPSGIALMIQFNKERTGYKDRKFIAGLAEGNADGDVWNSATITNSAALAALVAAEFTSTDSVKIQPSYFNRETEAVAPYTGGAASPTVSYQRRRKPGVGLT